MNDQLPHINGDYEWVKKAILYMIKFYSRDMLEDPGCRDLTIDEIEMLYQYNQSQLIRYQEALLLLEAEFILGIIN